MTLQEHNRILGILHLAYGGLHSLIFLGMFAFFVLMGMFGGPHNPNDPPAAFFAFMGVIFGVMGLIFAVPPFLAGYGFLKRKPWAKTAGIVSAALACLNFPHGTALGVYSFWFLFGEGKAYYDRSQQQQWAAQGQLRDAEARTSWDAYSSQRKGDYVPPSQPPNWR